MSKECNTCHKPIDWDPKKREALGTNRPLNPDGTIHVHTPAQFEQSRDTQTPQGTTTTTTPQNGKPVVITAADSNSSSTNGGSTTSLVSLTQEETRILKDLAAYLQDIKKAKWSS